MGRERAWYYTFHCTLLLPWPRDNQTRFQVVSLSIASVPILCLKDPKIEVDTIYPELLLTFGVIRWNKFPWVFAGEAILGEALVLREISFLIHLSFLLSSDLYYHVTLFLSSIFIVDSLGKKIPDWLTNRADILH